MNRSLLSFFYAVAIASSMPSTAAPLAPVTAEKVIVLAVPAQAEPYFKSGDPATTIASHRLGKALGVLGYRLELAFFPSTRTLAQANAGIVDGVFAQPNNSNTHYTNLLPVKTPTSMMNVSLYALNNTGPSQWRERTLNTIAITRSMQQAQVFELKGSQLLRTKSAYHSLKMLNSGRADAAILADEIVHAQQGREPGLTDKIIKLTPKLAPQTLHTFLHKRHHALVPALSEQLRLQYLTNPTEI